VVAVEDASLTVWVLLILFAVALAYELFYRRPRLARIERRSNELAGALASLRELLAGAPWDAVMVREVGALREQLRSAGAPWEPAYARVQTLVTNASATSASLAQAAASLAEASAALAREAPVELDEGRAGLNPGDEIPVAARAAPTAPPPPAEPRPRRAGETLLSLGVAPPPPAQAPTTPPPASRRVDPVAARYDSLLRLTREAGEEAGHCVQGPCRAATNGSGLCACQCQPCRRARLLWVQAAREVARDARGAAAPVSGRAMTLACEEDDEEGKRPTYEDHTQVFMAPRPPPAPPANDGGGRSA
jgi:hypothetical protein